MKIPTRFRIRWMSYEILRRCGSVWIWLWNPIRLLRHEPWVRFRYLQKEAEVDLLRFQLQDLRSPQGYQLLGREGVEKAYKGLCERFVMRNA